MGRRGPKPTPSSTLRLVGSRELERRVEGPRAVPGTPSPPSWLGREARAEWRRVVPDLARMGTLARIDRATVSAYCEAWAAYVEAVQDVDTHGTVQKSRDGVDQRTPYVALLKDARAAMQQLAQQLGLSPASRLRMTSKAPVEIDPLGAFVKDRKA